MTNNLYKKIRPLVDMTDFTYDVSYPSLSTFIEENRSYMFYLPRRSGKTTAIVDWMFEELSSIVIAPSYHMLKSSFDFYEKKGRAFSCTHNHRGRMYQPVDFVLLDEFSHFNNDISKMLNEMIAVNWIDEKTKIVGFTT